MIWKDRFQVMSMKNSLRKSYYLSAQSLEFPLLIIKTTEAYYRKIENIRE